MEIGKTELKQSSNVQQMWDEGSKFLSRFVHTDAIEQLNTNLRELSRKSLYIYMRYVYAYVCYVG